MKKLADFKVKKVELKTIYGGKLRALPTATVGGGQNNGCDDGPDDWPF